MLVYRLEHVECGFDPTHGPCQIPPRCTGTGDTPAYGTSGPPPETDWPGYVLNPMQVCGVADEQVDTWFGFDWLDYGDPDYERMWEYAHHIQPGWAFVQYSIPEYHVIRLSAQCIFDPSFAYDRQPVSSEFLTKHKVQYEQEAAA